jgi:ABC-type branched-subunit amino acid transport system substrate-binding protein
MTKGHNASRATLGLNRRHFLTGTAATLAAPWVCREAFGAEEVFRLGWIKPTTGKLASSFAPLYEGGLLAVSEINAAGGIMGRKIVLHEEDDEASPAKQPAVMSKIRDAGIGFVLGPTGSSQSLAALPIGSEAKIIQCGVANSGELADATKYPYNYMLVYTTEQEGRIGATYMVERIKAKKIGILYESTAFGEGLAAASTKAIKQLTGQDPTSVQSFLMTATDLSVQVRKLQQAGCDGLLVWMASNTHIGMAFNTLSQIGWLPPVIGHVNLFNETLMQQVPADSLENVYAVYYRNWTYSDKQPPNARAVALAKKFSEIPALNNIQAYIAGTPHYDFLYLIKHGIETAKSFDTDAVKRVLDNVKGFKAAIGTLGYSATNHAGVPDEDIVMARVIVKDGQSRGALRQAAS